MKDECPLVMITWLDSRQSDGTWRRLNGLAPSQPVRCVSVGWLLHNGENTKTLAQSFGDIDCEASIQAAGIKVIAACAVESIVRLEETAPLEALGPPEMLEAAE